MDTPNNFKNKNGFSLIELLVVMAIMGVLIGLAYSNLKVSKEDMACKVIYSAMQSAKMRAIATGYNAYVDFDMDGGAVSDNFYTSYLDTDGDTNFGETANALGDNEFNESNFPMPDSSGGFPGIALASGLSFGLPPTNAPAQTPTGGAFSAGVLVDGISFTGGSKRISFTSVGTPSGFGGSVYLYDNTDNLGRACGVVVSGTGIIRRWSWDGANWD